MMEGEERNKKKELIKKERKIKNKIK